MAHDDDGLARERAAWSSVAPAWRAWWHVFEEAATELDETLVRAAGVAPGHDVLDVATGLGEPALTAARVAGPGGRVLGVDLSRGMLSQAVSRAREQGIENVTFVEQDACALDVAPASFDAAVSRWGLMLMPEPHEAARRVHAALRPGARFSAAVWCEPERVPFLALARAVAAHELDLPAPDPSEPGPFRLAAPRALEQVFESAGFVEIRGEDVVVTFRFADGEDYARFALDLSSSLGRVVRELDESARERLRTRIAEVATKKYGDGRGVVFPCMSRMVVGCAAAAG